MKKITQFALAALLTLSAININAQSFLKKMADKANSGNKKEETKKGPGVELMKPYTKEFTDDLGIGGTYLMSDTMWLHDDIGRNTVYNEKKLNSNNNYYYVTSVKIEFARENQDKVVNALNFYYHEKSTPYYNVMMDEKRKKTTNTLYNLLFVCVPFT